MDVDPDLPRDIIIAHYHRGSIAYIKLPLRLPLYRLRKSIVDAAIGFDRFSFQWPDGAELDDYEDEHEITLQDVADIDPETRDFRVTIVTHTSQKVPRSLRRVPLRLVPGEAYFFALQAAAHAMRPRALRDADARRVGACVRSRILTLSDDDLRRKCAWRGARCKDATYNDDLDIDLLALRALVNIHTRDLCASLAAADDADSAADDAEVVSIDPFRRAPSNPFATHVAVHEEPGCRDYMEDRWIACDFIDALYVTDDDNDDDAPAADGGVRARANGRPRTCLYAIFDGHRGALAAAFCRRHMPHMLATDAQYATDLDAAVRRVCLKLDAEFNHIARADDLVDGTTLVSVVTRGDALHCHWVGDSEAVACRGNRTDRLVQPHKASREDERARIAASGGTVERRRATWRIEGMLAVARSIGDWSFANYAVARADGVARRIDRALQFIVLASDGLFDVISDDEVTRIVRRWYNSPGRLPQDVCRALVGEALRRDSRDNITAMVLTWPKADFVEDVSDDDDDDEDEE